jgi:transposase
VSQSRRRFSPEYRDEAVKMALDGSRSIAQVARDLGINGGTLGNWIAAYRKAHPQEEEPLALSIHGDLDLKSCRNKEKCS